VAVGIVATLFAEDELCPFLCYQPIASALLAVGLLSFAVFPAVLKELPKTATCAVPMFGACAVIGAGFWLVHNQHSFTAFEALSFILPIAGGAVLAILALIYADSQGVVD